MAVCALRDSWLLGAVQCAVTGFARGALAIPRAARFVIDVFMEILAEGIVKVSLIRIRAVMAGFTLRRT